MAQNLTNKSRLLEKYSQVVREDGLNTNKNVNIGINGGTGTLWVAGAATFGGTVGVTGTLTASGSFINTGPVNQGATTLSHPGLVAINSTASATAAQVASGYITSTSGAATTITLPSITAIAAALPGTIGQGVVFDLYIDNTAGANTVTITPDSSMTKSQVAQVATYGVPTFGLFTVASGVTGIGCFRLVFSSGTAACIARVF
jgi:hypothetical protein